MSDEDGALFIVVSFLVLCLISDLCANIGYELYGKDGFWVGLFICPILAIIYLFWVICIVGNR